MSPNKFIKLQFTAIYVRYLTNRHGGLLPRGKAAGTWS